MAPDVLDALQDADRCELACGVVSVGVKALDKGGDSGELVALLRTMERQEMPDESASMDVEQILAMVGTGLGK